MISQKNIGIGIALHFIFYIQAGPLFLTEKHHAQELLRQLTLDEKIGQLCMVAAQADPGNPVAVYNTQTAYIEHLITHYHIGGLIFLGKSDYPTLKNSITHFQTLSNRPLLIGLDAEWGIGMRVNSTENHPVIIFPRALTLGAIANIDSFLLYELGQYIGMQCKALGVHINFAPVVDVNTNPENPVINSRSFGEDHHLVAHKALMVMYGMQSVGRLACAKHFTGHGDTHIDSHYGLPIIEHSRDYLHAVDLYPFKHMIRAGIDAIMVGHLALAAYNLHTVPATLAAPIVTDLLQQELGFNGLIVTDGLGMSGITTSGQSSGDIACKALLAGNDILLCSVDVPDTVQAIKKAIDDGMITMDLIDKKVLKILCAKLWVLQQERSEWLLHYDDGIVLQKKLYQAAITVVNSASHVLPLPFCQANLTIINIGTHNVPYFNTSFNKNFTITDYHYTWDMLLQADDTLEKDCESANTLIITVYSDHNHGMIGLEYHAALRAYIQKMILHESRGKKIIVVLFCSPYMIKLVDNAPTIVVAYENQPAAQEAAALALQGIIKPHGKLPVTVSKQFVCGHGLLY